MLLPEVAGNSIKRDYGEKTILFSCCLLSFFLLVLGCCALNVRQKRRKV